MCRGTSSSPRKKEHAQPYTAAAMYFSLGLSRPRSLGAQQLAMRYVLVVGYRQARCRTCMKAYQLMHALCMTCCGRLRAV